MIKYYQHPKEADEKIMQLQVKGLNKSDIKALAEYIYKKDSSSIVISKMALV